ncbi:MAG: hypothetical protein R2941_24020 [Desulfobacterales bacterium]
MKFDPLKSAECLERAGRDKIITAEENKRKFIINNKSNNFFRKYQIDHCLITDGKKCDFLIVNCDRKDLFFVELKGSHLTDAFKQIDSTLDFFHDILGNFNSFNSIKVRIVLSKVNNPDNMRNSSHYIKLAKRLKKINKNEMVKDLIKYESTQMEESV